MNAKNPSAVPEEDPKSSTALQNEISSLRFEIARLQQQVADPVLNSRLAAIVESCDDAIISKTLAGIILTWNKGAERIFGWKAEEVIGKAINILIPPERQSEEPEILARIQRGQRVDHFETVRMTKDGRRIDISVTISPVRDATGRIVAASKVARDITLQKRFHEELRKAKEEAELANKAKDQFLSVLSHELRTPLSPALAEISYLEELAELPPAVRGNVAMIRRNIETEARLVDDLLDVTRIARGKLRLQLEPVNINHVLRAVVRMLQSEIDNKNLQLTISPQARRHHVLADAGRIQQILLNLLSNAVKFTPRGGSVQIRTTDAAEDRLRIEVIDNGIGIEPAAIKRLFDAFEQVDQTRQFGGLGLGLSIARSLVELHQGTIRATSGGPGKGATFEIELTSIPEPRRAAETETADRPKECAGLRVLLVEDHADTRNAMARLLRSLGCAVESAGSVREAMELTRRSTFDLLISDIGLPDGSGMEIMQHLREQKIRGIALSGFGQEEDLRRSLDAGFEAHITKPINFQSLRELVGRASDQKH